MSRKSLDLRAWLSAGLVLSVLVLIGLCYPVSQTTAGVGSRNVAVQANSKDQSEKKTRQTAEPWTGSPLGPENAFEDPNRDQSLQIGRVMSWLSINPGSVVADVGAGGGWFTVRAARRVGPRGLVYAQEILPKYTKFIEERACREGLTNVRTILGTAADPKLPANTMDAVLILNAYHEFEYPLTSLRRIYAAMKPGARLGFIERDTTDIRRAARQAYETTGQIRRRVDERPDQNPLTDDHRLAREVVEREAASVGFNKLFTVDLDLRAGHYLVVVERPR